MAHSFPTRRSSDLAFHQQTADELGGDNLSRAGEERLGEGWEVVAAMGVAWMEGLKSQSSNLCKGDIPLANIDPNTPLPR